MKKHIIFDFDDTLASSYDFNQQMFVDTFLAHDQSLDEQYLRSLHYSKRGTSMQLQFEEAVEHLKLKVDPKQLVIENEEMHKKRVPDISVFEGVLQMLETLKGKEKIMSICTNRQYGSLEKIIEMNKMRKYFQNIISCSDEGYEKPDPYCLLEVIKKTEIPEDQCIYFGDSKTDSEFASNAGIDYIVVDHYLNKRQFYKMIINIFTE